MRLVILRIQATNGRILVSPQALRLISDDLTGPSLVAPRNPCGNQAAHLTHHSHNTSLLPYRRLVNSRLRLHTVPRTFPITSVPAAQLLVTSRLRGEAQPLRRQWLLLGIPCGLSSQV